MLKVYYVAVITMLKSDHYGTACVPTFKLLLVLNHVMAYIPSSPTTHQAIKTPKLSPKWFFVPKTMVRVPWICYIPRGQLSPYIILCPYIPIVRLIILGRVRNG